MVEDPMHPGVAGTVAAPADDQLLALVYRVALECTGHRDERVRVAAGGTLDASFWTSGARDVAPVSGRVVGSPSPDQVRVEFVAALQLRQDAETDVQFAHARGVADWLALVIGARGDEPWWQPMLAAVVAHRPGGPPGS